MLTIAETVVRNRERRRRALQARREGKAVAQVVAEENHGRLARMVADSLAPIMASERPSEAAPAADAANPRLAVDDPRWYELEREVNRISGQIELIGRELTSFKEILSRVPPAQSPAPQPPPLPPAVQEPAPVAQAPRRSEEAARQPAALREAPGSGKVPLGDIAAMIDHIQQQYYR